MTGFDEAQFENTVKQMVVLKDGSIEFQLVGGEIRKWKDLQLSPNHHVPTLPQERNPPSGAERKKFKHHKVKAITNQKTHK